LSGDIQKWTTVSKGGSTLIYDIAVATPKGAVYAMFVRTSEIANPALATSMRTDDGHTGKRSDFEAAATDILPYDPVAKKRLNGTKRGAAIVSSDTAEDDQTPTIAYCNPAIGTTGVHLRYHKQQEYNKLSREQKDELLEWREKIVK
jgi:hypothetical protein